MGQRSKVGVWNAYNRANIFMQEGDTTSPSSTTTYPTFAAYNAMQLIELLYLQVWQKNKSIAPSIFRPARRSQPSILCGYWIELHYDSDWNSWASTEHRAEERQTIMGLLMFNLSGLMLFNN